MARSDQLRVLAAMTAMVAAVLLMSLVAPGLAQAQSAGTQITVNTADDTIANDAACSLREAMTNANSNDQSGSTDCPAGSASGEDSIVFDLGSSATITLGAQLPSITDAAGLAIDGGSAEITISGNDSVGVFAVNSGAKLALHNLTVADGRGVVSGGIHNSGGTLTVTNSTFSGHRNGGIDNFGGGTLTVANSTFSGNIGSDGGISNYYQGTLTVTNSTFSGNRSGFGFGGGIYNDGGTLTVSNSTFSGNSAISSSSHGFGGGIYNDGGTLTVSNSTFSGNSARTYGGGISNHGTLTVTNSTFSGNSASSNGGGIYTDGTATVRSTIVAGNTAPSGPNISGSTTGGFNFIGGDPLLGPLQDNGGPTQTRAPLPESPVIDQGNSFESSTDQRGASRPQDNPAIPNATGGDGADIGAVETAALTISGARVSEGDTGSVDAVFTVRLSGSSPVPVTVDYATEDDTAASAADYQATSGTLTFEPGQTQKTITVEVHGDTLDEFAEHFFMRLSNLQCQCPVTITDEVVVGMIMDNDPTPNLSIEDVTVTEGNSGTTDAKFTVSLSAASGKPVSADYATEDGSATAPDDYAETSDVLFFPAHTTERTIKVPIKNDAQREPDEDFFVNLSGANNATITDGQGKATILDAPDTTAPTVLSTKPAIRVRNAPPLAKVVVTFSEEMDALTLTRSTFKLIKKGKRKPVGASVEYLESGTSHKAILDPNRPLVRGATYVAVVTTGAKDLADNALDQKPNRSGNQRKIWTFTVGG